MRELPPPARPPPACRPPERSLPFVHVRLWEEVSLNEALAGKSYPSRRFDVSVERVRAFAEAVGAEVRGGVGEPAEASRVPPTFATAPEIEAMSEIIDDPELKLDFRRVVHTEQSYEWERPLRVGEALTVVPSIESIRAKAGSEILVVATEMRDALGELVVRARCTLVVRPVASEGG